MKLIFLGCALLLISVKVSESLPEFDLPTARIYQVQSDNRLRPWNKVDPETFETTVENVEALRLECMANYPVQWIYTGNGIPAFTSTNKYSRSNTHGETSTSFTASLLLSPVKEHHTGKYQCSPAQYIDGKTFFHIYVPGQSLFTALSGHNIVLPKNDSTITIPCTVSNPNAQVTLDKSERNVLRKIRVRSSDAVVYDPKIGFKVRTDRIDDPEGVYVCTAKYSSFVRSVEYKVTSSSGQYLSDEPAKLSKCKKKCGENAFCDVVDGLEVCKCEPEFNGDPDVKCVIKCNSHTDCPSTMSCFVDRQCRSPCVHSAVGCGINSKCKVENHRPVCYCPDNWIGDETIQCFNTLQGSQPSIVPDASSKVTPKLPSGVKCGSNTDCPTNTTCVRVTPSSKECIDPCATRVCGTNARCIVDYRRASCECLPGFVGDARVDCRPNKLKEGPLYEPLIQGDQAVFVENVKSFKKCGKPELCGLYAQCRVDKNGNEQCLCKEGYMGQPPKCRPECRQNKDCPGDHVCVSDSRVGYPTCAKTCGSRICGAHADCLEIEAGNIECFCPSGMYGDPLVKCETSEMRIGRDCSFDFDCGVQLKCDIGDFERKCSDPCKEKTCRGDLVCEVEDHKAKCSCPRGFTGNEYVGCNRDVNIDESGLALCANLTCGANSECRIVDGKPACFCQSGFIGKPPVCISECYSNSDCPSDLTCIQKRCRHRCEGCGNNTKCRVAPTLDRNSVCSCLDGFEGNPYAGCRPIL